jgi:hypothetical protein
MPIRIIAIVSAAILGAGLIYGLSEAARAPSTHSSTKLPYRVSWSGDLAGWTYGGDRWTVHGKLLQYSGDAASDVLAPTRVTDANYAVEAVIRLVNFKDTGLSESRGFGILLRSRGAADPTEKTVGLVAGVGRGFMGCDGVSSQAVFTSADTDYTSLKQSNAAYYPNHAWHTYRAEVRGNAIKLIIDGKVRNTVTTKQSAGGELVGLYSLGAQLQIKRFTISAL